MGNDVSFTVQKDCGTVVKFLKSEYQDENDALNLVHAYAMTIYSCQGATIDGDTFILYDVYMGRAASYVAGSRHKDTCHWFVNGSKLNEISNVKMHKNTSIYLYRLETLAKCMRAEKYCSMALEHNWEETP